MTEPRRAEAAAGRRVLVEMTSGRQALRAVVERDGARYNGCCLRLHVTTYGSRTS